MSCVNNLEPLAFCHTMFLCLLNLDVMGYCHSLSKPKAELLEPHACWQGTIYCYVLG